MKVDFEIGKFSVLLLTPTPIDVTSGLVLDKTIIIRKQSPLIYTKVGLGGEVLISEGFSRLTLIEDLVGEREPELIIPKQSGTVIPNEKIRQVGNNSPIIINLHVTTNGNSPKEMAYDLFEAVEEVFKTNANLLRVRMNMAPV